MFTVKVRDHIMIAHSFKGEVFGPAQALHGATFIVDATFKRRSLSADNIVVDIGLATTVLKEILSEISYRNLDDMEGFAGQNTTTEFLAQWIHGRMSAAVRTGRLGQDADSIETLAIELGESHIAWAGYEGPLA